MPTTTAQASAIRICRMALSHIGADSTIESFDEPTVAARECTTWYDQSRLEALETYDWNFAKKRVALALHGDTISETSTDPMAGVWGFRYAYPDDCVIMRKIQNSASPPDDEVPFEIETSLDGTEKTILTNMDNAIAVYTWDQTHANLFTPLFSLALSHLVAHHIAFPITGKRSIITDQFNLYEGLAARAAASVANEGASAPPRDADHIRARV